MTVRILDSLGRVAALSDTQLAYIAALIDGEGSLECNKEMQPRGATPRFSLRLQFTFATAEPATTVAGWLGLRVKWRPSVDAKRSPTWALYIYRSVTLALVRRALPYLILKKRQAELMIEIEEVRKANTPSRRHFGTPFIPRMPAGAIDQMDGLWRELRGLKSNKRRMDARVNQL